MHAQPRARRAAILGPHRDAAGRPALRIAVTELPEKNRATEAVCAALARALGVPTSRVSLRSGAGSRNKVLHVAGDPTQLEAALQELMRDG